MTRQSLLNIRINVLTSFIIVYGCIQNIPDDGQINKFNISQLCMVVSYIRICACVYYLEYVNIHIVTLIPVSNSLFPLYIYKYIAYARYNNNYIRWWFDGNAECIKLWMLYSLWQPSIYLSVPISNIYSCAVGTFEARGNEDLALYTLCQSEVDTA